MERKVKNILFRIGIKGNGVVNFDSKDQKWLFRDTNLRHMWNCGNDNANYAKKRFYKDADDNLSYKLIISSDCLRHDIFKDDALNQSQDIQHNSAILYSFIASPAALLRGYLFPSTETLKRKSPITITDAEQSSNSESHLETFSRSGKKDKSGEVVDNSYFFKEVVGDIEYSAMGNIDLMELQFVSCSQEFDRFAFCSDQFEMYKKLLSARLKNFDSELGYYKIKKSIIDIPEQGFLFSDENVNVLVKEFFNRLVRLNIKRKNAFANAAKIEYKLVYDVIEDTFDNKEGWINLTNQSDIDNIKFDTEFFYELQDENKVKRDSEQIEKSKSKRCDNNTAKKKAENDKKELAKAKKLKVKEQTEVTV